VNTQNNRQGAFLISAIMAVVLTALFLVVPVTLTFVIAYILALLGIGMFCGGTLYMMSNPKAFSWFAAFPMTIWRYITAQLCLSATFVVRDLFWVDSFPLGLFVFLHIVLLGFFAILLILIKGGKDIIQMKDAEVKQKVNTLRLMQADVESIMRQHPQHEESLKKVAEAIRYSDPMSNPAIAFYDEQIQRSIFSITGLEGNDPASIPEICESILKQIADRNARLKLMK